MIDQVTHTDIFKEIVITTTEPNIALQNTTVIDNDRDSMKSFLRAEIRYLLDLVAEEIFPMSWAGMRAKPIEDLLMMDDLTIEEVLAYCVEQSKHSYSHLHDTVIKFNTFTTYGKSYVVSEDV